MPVGRIPNGARQTDQRWYPAKNADVWASKRRQSVFDGVVHCITQAFGSGEQKPETAERLTSDHAFHELRVCVIFHARTLFALGQTEDGVVRLIVAAAKRSTGSLELPPAIVAAIDQWTREAKTGSE